MVMIGISNACPALYRSQVSGSKDCTLLVQSFFASALRDEPSQNRDPNFNIGEIPEGRAVIDYAPKELAELYRNYGLGQSVFDIYGGVQLTSLHSRTKSGNFLIPELGSIKKIDNSGVDIASLHIPSNLVLFVPLIIFL